MLVHRFLEKSTHKYPNKVALVHGSIRATYNQINRDANRLCGFFQSQGITPGARIILLLENCYEYVISYYGTLKAGAIAVPLATNLKPNDIGHFIKELEPWAMVSSTRFERLLKASDLRHSELNTLVIHNPKLNWDSESFQPTSLDDILKDNLTHNEIDLTPNSLASIIFTSGSSGRPKGVMLSHGNIVANTKSICEYLNLTDEDIQMVVLPFFYVMGKSLLNTHFAVGGRVVINNQFAFPASVLNQMISEKVTGFSGVPSTYAFLLHRSPLASYRDKLTTLRYCTQAGGHMATVQKKSLRKILPDHTKLIIMYGATEASARLTYLDPAWFDKKIDSIGKPIPGVSLKVIDGNGNEVPIGQNGEIVAQGTNIMQGYWRKPSETRLVLDHNGYHTGDYGYQDDEGFFYLSGREDSLLKVGGHRISPQEIEDALISTNLASEAIVVGMADDLLGSKLISLVTPLSGNLTSETIFKACNKILPKHKIPSKIIQLKSLPKSANGKIDRQECFRIAEAANSI